MNNKVKNKMKKIACSERTFHLKITIEGRPGSGKGILRNKIYHLLDAINWPVRWDPKYENQIFTSLPD